MTDMDMDRAYVATSRKGRVLRYDPRNGRSFYYVNENPSMIPFLSKLYLKVCMGLKFTAGMILFVKNLDTLGYQINVQDGINMQVGKFLQILGNFET